MKKDITPFIKFCLEASVESLTGIKGHIIYFIRKFSLRDFYTWQRRNKALTSRQFELLGLLLDNPIAITLKDLHDTKPFSILYNKVTTQTARRDLKKLVAAKLLVVDDDNKHSLNYRVLG